MSTVRRILGRALLIVLLIIFAVCVPLVRFYEWLESLAELMTSEHENNEPADDP